MLVRVGKQYQRKTQPGATADFLRSNVNTLVVSLDNIDVVERAALKVGSLHCGLLSEDGAILFLWQFCDSQGDPVFSFDSPFDVRLIENPTLHDITNSEQRLTVDLHAIERTTNVVVTLRHITMPPELTLAFLSAAQDQLVNPDSGVAKMNEWMRLEPRQLVAKTKMYEMGT